MSRNICHHLGCKRKVPTNIKNNPQGEPLCAVHHGFQVRLNEDRIKCTTIGCSNMALSNGLCKNHTHSPREPRMDLRLEYLDARTAKLKETLGPVLKEPRSIMAPLGPVRLDNLHMGSFNCLYCGENAHSSLGPSPPHCCPVCWSKIEKIN